MAENKLMLYNLIGTVKQTKLVTPIKVTAESEQQAMLKASTFADDLRMDKAPEELGTGW